MNEFLELTIIAILSVIALFIIGKMLGKRQIAQLEIVDYIIGISIGSIAAEMATDTSDKPFYYYLIAIGIYFLFSLLINFLGRKTPYLKHFFKGRPLTIIYEGKINFANLKKSKLSVNDMISLAREQGYFDITDIEFAVLEDSGHLSIMPISEKRPATTGDLDIKTEKGKFPFYMVTDGKISYSSLNELNKSESWLMKKLQINNRKELKNIILAIYDDKTNKMIINYKN